jgi:guanylate kinase
MSRGGTLFVVAAPSGAGKTSLVKKLLATTPDVVVSVSHTTRPMRPGEQDGVDYHFVSVDEFEKMVEDAAFLEHALVFDRYYGTSEAQVRKNLAEGRDVILEIDWQGARQVRKLVENCVSIFILPPSRDVLEQRLRSRAQDSEEVIARRTREAIGEMEHYAEFDYLLVNDDFDKTLEAFRCIVSGERLRTVNHVEKIRDLISNLLK